MLAAEAKLWYNGGGNMNILIVEDDEDIAEMVAWNLEKQGWQVSIETAGSKGLERNYPRIRKAAKSVGAEIYRCDETGVSTRENFQRGYAPKGQTPLLSVTSVVSCRISMISAVSCRGALSFHVYSGALNVRRFLRFAQAVVHDSTSRKTVLVVDNLRVHHAKLVRAWAARHRKEIKIFYLPAYSPELNPDELVNSDLKLGVGQREPAVNKEEPERQVCEHMETTKVNPDKVRNFFQKSSVRHAVN